MLFRSYKVSHEEALDEVSDPEAEHLLEYISDESVRKATSVLMQKHGFN